MAKAKKPAKVDLRAPPKIVIRGIKQRVWGFAAHPDFSLKQTLDPAIEISIKARGVRRMEVALHEALHVVRPGLPEETVRTAARYQALVLNALGYSADDDAMDEMFSGPDPNEGKE